MDRIPKTTAEPDLCLWNPVHPVDPVQLFSQLPLLALLRDLLVNLDRLLERLLGLAASAGLDAGLRGPSRVARSRRCTTGRSPAAPGSACSPTSTFTGFVCICGKCRSATQLTLVDRHVERQVVRLVVGRHVLRRRPTWPLTISSTFRVVARRAAWPPIGGARAAISGANATFAFTVTLPGFVELHRRRTGRLAVDRELQGVGVAVGDVRAALGQALAPVGEVDLVDLAELHVDAALADAAAADAREVGLAADLEREAAVHDVIPAVPLRHAGGVHGADEVAQALRRSSRRSPGRRCRSSPGSPGSAAGPRRARCWPDQLRLGEACRRRRRRSSRTASGSRPLPASVAAELAVLVGVELGEQPLGGGRRVDSPARWPSGRSR